MDVKKSRGLMKFPRLASLATSALFLFFLIYSTPHQVHHFFDQHKASHSNSRADQDPQGERHKPNSQDTTCVFQIVAKSCHLSAISFIDIFSAPVSTKNLSSLCKARIASYLLSDAFQIRAPPEA
jgi:hypothetical protein